MAVLKRSARTTYEKSDASDLATVMAACLYLHQACGGTKGHERNWQLLYVTAHKTFFLRCIEQNLCCRGLDSPLLRSPWACCMNWSMGTALEGCKATLTSTFLSVC